MSSHSVARRIAFNTLAQGIGRLGNLVLNLIAMLALVRYLGAAGYGSYIFIINFTTLFGLIGDFGISQVAVREISRHTEKANSLLTMSTTLRLGLSSLAMLICIVIINSIEASVEERLGVLLASGVFLVQALGSFNSIFQANLAMQYDSLTNFISRAVDTSLILLFIAQGRGLLPFPGYSVAFRPSVCPTNRCNCYKAFSVSAGLGCNLFTYVVTRNPGQSGWQACR